jgi:hypothetical protein
MEIRAEMSCFHAAETQDDTLSFGSRITTSEVKYIHCSFRAVETTSSLTHFYEPETQDDITWHMSLETHRNSYHFGTHFRPTDLLCFHSHFSSMEI